MMKKAKVSGNADGLEREEYGSLYGAVYVQMELSLHIRQACLINEMLIYISLMRGPLIDLTDPQPPVSSHTPILFYFLPPCIV